MSKSQTNEQYRCGRPCIDGAEMAASFEKENHLAPLVDTRTAGEVLGGANFKLPGGYVLRMPVAGWCTWQGDCIEGKGFEPDISIENSPESLAAGVDNQLQAALEAVKNAVESIH
jgi:tricorn protease